jgi:hypothetical protein
MNVFWTYCCIMLPFFLWNLSITKKLICTSSTVKVAYIEVTNNFFNLAKRKRENDHFYYYYYYYFGGGEYFQILSKPCLTS